MLFPTDLDEANRERKNGDRKTSISLLANAVKWAICPIGTAQPKTIHEFA